MSVILCSCSRQGEHCPQCLNCVQEAVQHEPHLLKLASGGGEFLHKCCGAETCIVEDEGFIEEVLELIDLDHKSLSPKQARFKVILFLLCYSFSLYSLRKVIAIYIPISYVSTYVSPSPQHMCCLHRHFTGRPPTFTGPPVASRIIGVSL